MARRADHTSGQCVGVSHVRTDAVAKAAGTALYPQDVPLPPGCLHAVTVRAPVARAWLRRLNTAPATVKARQPKASKTNAS